MFYGTTFFEFEISFSARHGGWSIQSSPKEKEKRKHSKTEGGGPWGCEEREPDDLGLVMYSTCIKRRSAEFFSS